MNLNLSVQPAAEPVSTADAKTHLRVTHSNDDTEIDAFVSAARRAVENFTRRSLITQTWVLKLDRFPGRRVIELERPPIQSVTSVAYIDTNGDSQVYSSSNYTVDTDSAPGRISLNSGNVWPQTKDIPNAVTVTYVAGYGDAGSDITDVELLLGIKLLVAYWYANRGDISTDGRSVDLPLPKTFQFLLYPLAVFV